MSQSHYDILNILPNASLPEIKKQFRLLAIKYHPDHPETGDAQIFTSIAKAYECLADSDKRHEYDKALELELQVRKSDYINHKKEFNEFVKLNAASSNNLFFNSGFIGLTILRALVI